MERPAKRFHQKRWLLPPETNGRWPLFAEVKNHERDRREEKEEKGEDEEEEEIDDEEEEVDVVEEERDEEVKDAHDREDKYK